MDLEELGSLRYPSYNHSTNSATLWSNKMHRSDRGDRRIMLWGPSGALRSRELSEPPYLGMQGSGEALQHRGYLEYPFAGQERIRVFGGLTSSRPSPPTSSSNPLPSFLPPPSPLSFLHTFLSSSSLFPFFLLSWLPPYRCGR